MNVFADFQSAVAAVVARLGEEGRLPQGLDTGRIVVEPPRDTAHGDLATNAAMVLAKDAGLKPRALADMLAEELRHLPQVVEVSVAGPGFINLRLAPAAFDAVLRACLTSADFGASEAGQRRRVNVEYVSANPTGPMHVGHGRGAVFGDALAALLGFAGHEVTREYYINDAGAQVDVLARSAHLRYREALGEEIGAIPEGLYPGDYLKPVGAALAAKHGRALLEQPESVWLAPVRAAAIDAMMAMIRDDLAAMGIVHDVFFSERSLHEGGAESAVARAIAHLRERGLVYEGRLERPKGAPAEDWEDREQTLFRATDYGDDVDRPLMKSDGSFTYFASDIAYHRDKFLRGFPLMIDVWGADHGGYIRRLQAATRAITGGEGSLVVEICQLVKLLRGGVEVKMSKRSGTFVTLREVIDEVGRDAVRFMMLMRKNDAVLDFDLAKVIEQSKENPVFYVQYAHARSASIRRQALLALPELDLDETALAAAELTLLSHPAERQLIGLVAQWPRLVEAAAQAREPHRVAFFLYELASQLHGLWTKGRDQPDLRFVKDDDRHLTLARLALVTSVKRVIALGLGLLGVSAPEEMR
jgi:arginyl-tRNA synthetase